MRRKHRSDDNTFAANVTSQEDLDALRLRLSLFFAERAQKAIDKMWDKGTFNQKKLDELAASI